MKELTDEVWMFPYMLVYLIKRNYCVNMLWVCVWWIINWNYSGVVGELDHVRSTNGHIRVFDTLNSEPADGVDMASLYQWALVIYLIPWNLSIHNIALA